MKLYIETLYCSALFIGAKFLSETGSSPPTLPYISAVLLHSNHWQPLAPVHQPLATRDRACTPWPLVAATKPGLGLSLSALDGCTCVHFLIIGFGTYL